MMCRHPAGTRSSIFPAILAVATGGLFFWLFLADVALLLNGIGKCKALASAAESGVQLLNSTGNATVMLGGVWTCTHLEFAAYTCVYDIGLSFGLFLLGYLFFRFRATFDMAAQAAYKQDGREFKMGLGQAV